MAQSVTRRGALRKLGLGLAGMALACMALACFGLAMAYSVVQLHHGSVEFTSVAGQGATFYLRFPLSENGGGGEPSRAVAEDSVSQA